MPSGSSVIENCANLDLPPVTANFCSPDVSFGQVDKIFLGNIGNPFADWSSLTEWNSRLDNADVSDKTKVRYLHVVGDKPIPESTELDISLKRKVTSPKKHTVNIKIDETGALNYALLKAVENQPGQTAQILLWYQAGKYLYGGNAGIRATLKLDDQIPENDEELALFVGTLTWEGAHPDRITNPLA